jgi:predicted nucleotidyltransferase
MKLGRTKIMKQTKILSYLQSIKPSLQKDGIEKIGLFGSFAKNRNDITSDIDIIIKFNSNFFQSCDPWNYFDVLEKIKFKIEKQFHIKVDIFDEDSSSPHKDRIIKETIYV